jgi:hypothetical protein
MRNKVATQRTKEIHHIIAGLALVLPVLIYGQHKLATDGVFGVKFEERITLKADIVEASSGEQEEPSITATPSVSPTPIMAETRTGAGGATSNQSEIEAYIHKVFGKDAERGIRMLKKCENGRLNPTAINWNKNGTWDYGLWQINQIHNYTREQLADPFFNTDVAFKIFTSWGNNFSAWSCAEHAGDIPYYKL